MKNINNGTWVSPFGLQLQTLFFLILITLFVESLIIYLYAKRKNLNDIRELLYVVIISNSITGLIGLIFAIFWS